MRRQTKYYATELLSLAAAIGDEQQDTILIPTNEPFECKFIMGAALQAGVIVTNWGGTVMIQDNVKDRALFSEEILFSLIAGDGRNPFPLDPPRLFPGASTVTITFTNNVATATQVQLVFYGNKLLEE